MSKSDKPAPPADSGEKVPLWIISFADMITLLLSFFVMLQTMSKARDATMFAYAGRDSFRRTIAGMGMPDVIFGEDTGFKLDYRKIKYPVEEASPPNEPPPNRIIDAEDDVVRNAYADLLKSIEGRAGDLKERPLAIRLTGITFDAGSWELPPAGEAELENIVSELKHAMGDQPINVYVVGLAGDEQDSRAQWQVSARRAGTVEARLRRALADEVRRDRLVLSSWGAGPGGAWCRKLGLRSGKESYIGIAITKAQ